MISMKAYGDVPSLIWSNNFLALAIPEVTATLTSVPLMFKAASLTPCKPRTSVKLILSYSLPVNQK